jgi:hypothetical protein
MKTYVIGRAQENGQMTNEAAVFLAIGAILLGILAVSG